MAAKKRRSAVKKVKKTWFTVIAPDIFKNVEVGEIVGIAPADLINRTVGASYSTITNSPGDRNKAFILRVVKADTSKAYTEPIKITYSAGFIGRMSRRSKTKFLFVGDYDTKDGRKVTVKGYLCANSRTPQAIKTAMRKKLDGLLASKFKKVEHERIFGPNYVESLSKELRSQLKPIYPINNVLFWKIIVQEKDE